MEASPPLTCCSLYKYLSPSSTGLFSSSFSENREQREETGYQQACMLFVSHQVAQVPGGSSSTQPLCLWPLDGVSG